MTSSAYSGGRRHDVDVRIVAGKFHYRFLYKRAGQRRDDADKEPALLFPLDEGGFHCTTDRPLLYHGLEDLDLSSSFS
jgi:hypothetical protein